MENTVIGSDSRKNKHSHNIVNVKENYNEVEKLLRNHKGKEALQILSEADFGNSLDIWREKEGVITVEHVAKTKEILESWVRKRGRDADCQELIDILEKGEFHVLAEYLKFCLLNADTTNPRSLDFESGGGGLHKDTSSSQNLMDKNHPNESFLKICSTRKQTVIIFIASLVLALIGIITLAVALTILFSNVQKVSLPVILNTTTDITEMPDISFNKYKTPECIPLRMKLRKGNENVIINRMTLNWTDEDLNFCNHLETQLIINNDYFYVDALSKISCRERVTAIEVVNVKVSQEGLKHIFNNFCSIRNISFTGSICNNEDINDVPISVKGNTDVIIFPSLRHIIWQNINFCGVNMFSLFKESVHAPNLQSMHFECVRFEETDFDILNNVTEKSQKLRNVFCSDENLCMNFNLNVNSKVNVITEQNSCSE